MDLLLGSIGGKKQNWKGWDGWEHPCLGQESAHRCTATVTITATAAPGFP